MRWRYKLADCCSSGSESRFNLKRQRDFVAAQPTWRPIAFSVVTAASFSSSKLPKLNPCISSGPMYNLTNWLINRNSVPETATDWSYGSIISTSSAARPSPRPHGDGGAAGGEPGCHTGSRGAGVCRARYRGSAHRRHCARGARQQGFNLLLLQGQRNALRGSAG